MNRKFLIILASLGMPFLGFSMQLPTPKPLLTNNINGLSSKALSTAIVSYLHAKKDGYVKKPIMLLVDFTKPSNQRRLYILDMRHPFSPTAVFYGFVGQGIGSGKKIAKHFSNAFNSHMSSLGGFVTTNNPYSGRWGYSLRIKGIEAGINNNAYDRAVILHGDPQVNEKIAKEYGYVHPSWGCFSLNKKYSTKIINTVKGGSFIFAYAKQESKDPYTHLV